MRKSIRTGLIAGAIAAAGIGLTAAPAAAADASWTVTGASGYAYGYSDDTQLRVPRSGAVLKCVDAEADATINNGSYSSTVGTIDSTTWTTCTGPFGLTFNVTHGGTWNIKGVQPTADPAVNVGSITNISASISGPACSATFTGGVPGYYRNATGTLSVDPTAPNPGNVSLVASGVTGCLGIIQNGDTAQFTGNFEIDPNTIDLTYVP
ncbi:hypothetical protein [Actinomadura rugatobispora]|uniref:Secreted protein n=1 Tax=Actinomadura rugatobispora TaxID=1994 RepID=A0ABW1A172_9ACTN|nr:hypothetical protein GCM10010200_014440 [Actinomadura rugatobispora]